jgi:hypothetical protein
MSKHSFRLFRLLDDSNDSAAETPFSFTKRSANPGWLLYITNKLSRKLLVEGWAEHCCTITLNSSFEIFRQ